MPRELIKVNNAPFFALVRADSIAPTGERLLTLELHYPRVIHAQMLMHRMFSRNAQSSRAMPAQAMRSQEFYVPRGLQRNQKGMVGGDYLEEPLEEQAQGFILQLLESAIACTEALERLGVHKQWVNRYLEPWQVIKAVYTGTMAAWEHFFSLRLADDAQPEIQAIAREAKKAIDSSTPRTCMEHLPWLLDEESTHPERGLICAARAARVSYGFGKCADTFADLNLARRLLADKHMSPFEHVAYAAHGTWDNFVGWQSLRRKLEGRT